jgi:predicted nucleic acid-binding protein
LNLLVDTSVWSLALRRDAPDPVPQVIALADALQSGRPIVTTGLILQELLQGFAGPRAQTRIIERFRDLPLIMPERRDHVDAAALRNQCRRAGVQLGTNDALLAQLCIRHRIELLTTDRDFEHAAALVPLRVWRPLTAR